MGSGIMVSKPGTFWKENPNSKGLDNPRKVRGEYILTTCISKGIQTGGGGDSKMQFASRSPEELYGKQKKTYVQQAPREDKPTKKMPTPDKKVG